MGSEITACSLSIPCFSLSVHGGRDRVEYRHVLSVCSSLKDVGPAVGGGTSASEGSSLGPSDIYVISNVYLSWLTIRQSSWQADGKETRSVLHFLIHVRPFM